MGVWALIVKKQGRRVDGPVVVDVLWELSYYDFA